MKKLCWALVMIGLIVGASRAAGQTPPAGQAPPAPVPATPENVATFLGIWTIEATGSYGPVSLEATLKAAAGKVTGDVSSAQGKVTISDVTKAGSSLVFVYSFDYQGMPITAVVTLTPADKKVDAYIDMAGGAASFSGTATKKAG